MTNKVKPFYIRITDDMTPQMVQDAFDKCVDAGASAFECVANTNRKHQYTDLHEQSFEYFGVDSENNTYTTVVSCAYGDKAQEITLDQLDEWLGIVGGSPKQDEWDGEGLPPIGVECEFTPDNTWWGFNYIESFAGIVLHYEGEQFVFMLKHEKYKLKSRMIIVSRTDKGEFSKPETPEQKAERERLEAIHEMVDDFNDSDTDYNLRGKVAKVCAALYDAGYRKQ